MGISLILGQAETSPAHPYNLAEQLANDLINVPGGARMFKVKGKLSPNTVSGRLPTFHRFCWLSLDCLREHCEPGVL